jgi:hypothetical protein
MRVDNTPPTVTTTAGSLDATLECSDGPGLAAALAQAPAATDNCDSSPTIHLISDVITPGSCPANYVQVRTWNFTDSCGNTSADFVQTITVQDTTPPTLGACPPNIIVTCAHVGGELVSFTAPTSSDACSTSVVVCRTNGVAITSPNIFPAGVTPVVCTATDACGNVSAPCTFTVTVNDTVDPVIVCPPDALVQCPDPTTPSATGSATATDNCDPDPDVTFVDAAPIEVTPATPDGWSLRTTSTGTAGYVNGPGSPPLPSGSVALAVGNDSGALAETRLTGYDGTRLADLTELAYSAYRSVVPVGGVNEDILLLLEVDSDNNGICDDVLIFEPEWQGTPVLHATWQRWNALSGKWWSQFNGSAGGTRGAGVKPLSDYLAVFPDAKICGSGGQPGIALRAGLVFGAWQNFAGNADFFAIGVSGTSSTYNFELTPANQCPTLDIIIRTWTATDSSGNQSSCSQAIVVQDTVPPVLAGCDPVSVPNDVGACSAVVNYAPTATDACSGSAAVTCSPASGGTFPVGTTTVSCSATDACGNTGTCSFTVTVFDAEPPVASCPANITQSNDPNQCGAGVTFTAGAIDNCPGATVACVPASGSFFTVGTSTVTCTPTDAAGNVGPTCSFTVTVNDTQPPVATCPADIITGNDAGVCSAVVNYTAGAADNCPGAIVACVPASGSAFIVGTTTVTCTATDAAGNTGTCSFTVTVNDTEAPVATCPANITTGNDPGLCSAVVTFTATATDNCPGQSIVCVPASGTAFAVGSTTVTCTATDAAGNTASCSFTVTVNDTEPPVATAGSIGACYTTVAAAEAAAIAATTATDNCGPITFSAATVGTCTAVVTVTATDGAGLTATATYNTRIDNTAPVLGAITATQGANNVLNNDCSVNPVVQGTVTITVVASDDCGLAGGHPSVVLVNGANTADISGSAVEGPPGTFTYTWIVNASTEAGTWTATVTASDLCQTDTDTFTLCVNPCQITGLVQLESFIGTGTLPTPHTRQVTFVATEVIGTTTNVLRTWVLDLSNVSGDTFSYTLTDVPSDLTNLSAKTDWNKRRNLAVSLDPDCQGVVNFTGAAQLRGGDITGDNVVNLADYSSLVSHWLDVVSSTPAAAVADMNGDGVINILDYVILGTNWFTTGDLP